MGGSEVVGVVASVGRGGVRHVVVDYGGVISEYQSAEDEAALLAAAGTIAGGADVRARYWASRLAYDRGDLEEAAYWSAVTGQALAADDPALAELVRLDVRSWSRTRERSLREIAELAAQGHPLALLSNTPRPHAQWMSDQPWAAHFRVHVFSYRLRVAKPEPEIFRHALAALGCRPEEAVFVDDRAENVDGARAVGMAAVLFDGEDAWDAVRGLLR